MQHLKARFSYPKFRQQPYKILYLDDDYFLQKESIAALKQLGHDVTVLNVIHNPTQMLAQILKTAVIIQPDCIMSINHAGFDPEGKIAHILSELSVPVLLWYLDDFRFIILKGDIHANPNTAIFTFEKQHISALRETGFEHVFHLPSATVLDPARNYKYAEFAGLSNATVFIGSTFNKSKAARYKPRFPKWTQQLEQQLDLTQLQHNLFTEIKETQRHYFDTNEAFYHYASYAMCHATAFYRRHWLQNVAARDFHVMGDEDWRKANIPGKVHGPVHNVTVAPHIFKMALINLCFSSQQLGSSVSLRAFDIPAAGGFLLTDWKDDLAELFDAENEIVSFRSVDEMNDLIAYYEKYPDRREPVIQRARERVKNEHQVIHRIQKMLEIAAKIW